VEGDKEIKKQRDVMVAQRVERDGRVCNQAMREKTKARKVLAQVKFTIYIDIYIQTQ